MTAMPKPARVTARDYSASEQKLVHALVEDVCDVKFGFAQCEEEGAIVVMSLNGKVYGFNDAMLAEVATTLTSYLGRVAQVREQLKQQVSADGRNTG
jgi:hypothetical protein